MTNTTLRAKCAKCGDERVVDGKYCRIHHIESKKAEWLDNTDINNLGIVKWAHDMMPEFAPQATPQFHLELFHNLLMLYDPTLRNKYERLLEWIGFRESAKSTVETLISSYILAHNGERFKITIDGEIRDFHIKEKTIVIISQTSGSAEEFVVRIRDAFSESERLRYYYRVSIQDAIDSLTGQWTRTAFRLNNCYVIGVGSGQMIRGKVKGASRPTLVFGDDIYSETNVITPESRLKMKKWWNNAVMNSIDNLEGKVVVLGTIVHEDTVIVEMERNPMWKTIKVPVMGYLTDKGESDLTPFHKFQKEYMTIDWDLSQCRLPYDEIENPQQRMRKQREYFDKVQKSYDWQLRWPERIDLYLLAIKFKEAVYNQTVAGFYQEYFHVIVPPSEKRFRKEMFLKAKPFEMKYEYGYNWIKLENEEKWRILNIEFGVDLAGAGTDDMVVSVVGALSDSRVIVLQQAIGKWSIRDDLRGETAQDLRLNKVTQDRTSISKIGLVDETFRLALRYHPTRIKVGVAGEEELTVREMRRVFQENRMYTVNIQSRPQTSREGRKEQRILGTLLPYYETRMVYHTASLEKLEYQLEYLGRTKHDDCSDSLECAFFNLEFPQKLTIDFFEKKDAQEYIPAHLKHLIKPTSEYNLFNNWQEYS